MGLAEQALNYFGGPGTADEVRTFVFGENPANVKLTDPNLAQAAQTREYLRKRYMQQLEGGPTAGEQAITQAARTGAEQLEESTKGRAAGARGFARLAALSNANQAANVGKQRILGQAATAAGAQRAQDIARIEANLMGLGPAALQQVLLEQELRNAGARPGILGVLGMLAGAGIGAAYGDPVQGAQLGGALGSSVQQFGQRWT